MRAGIMYEMSTYSAEAWQRLGWYVRNERTNRGWTQEDLADLAGVAVGTVRGLEQGDNKRPLTLPKISRALGWTGESAELILMGGEPIIVPPIASSDALLLERPEGLSAEAWAEIREDLTADFEKYLRHRRQR